MTRKYIYLILLVLLTTSVYALPQCGPSSILSYPTIGINVGDTFTATFSELNTSHVGQTVTLLPQTGLNIVNVTPTNIPSIPTIIQWEVTATQEFSGTLTAEVGTLCEDSGAALSINYSSYPAVQNVNITPDPKIGVTSNLECTAIDTTDGYSGISGSLYVNGGLSETYELIQNLPNPTPSATTPLDTVSAGITSIADKIYVLSNIQDAVIEYDTDLNPTGFNFSITPEITASTFSLTNNRTHFFIPNGSVNQQVLIYDIAGNYTGQCIPVANNTNIVSMDYYQDELYVLQSSGGNNIYKYDLSGNLQQDIPLSVNARTLDVYGDKIYIIRGNTSGVEELQEYDLSGNYIRDLFSPEADVPLSAGIQFVQDKLIITGTVLDPKMAAYDINAAPTNTPYTVSTIQGSNYNVNDNIQFICDAYGQQGFATLNITEQVQKADNNNVYSKEKQEVRDNLLFVLAAFGTMVAIVAAVIVLAFVVNSGVVSIGFITGLVVVLAAGFAILSSVLVSLLGAIT